MEITDKEYEKILKEYFLILEKYTNLDYKCTELQNENNKLKKIINIVEGKLLETCEIIDKELRKWNLKIWV